jgi:hypothetical protein
MSLNIQVSEAIPETSETETQKIKKRVPKETIPIAVKNTLWNLYFQNNINGVCQCCKHEVISKNNFDCGHIVSEKEGGLVSLDNLRPICRSCNSSMGTLNMDVFMKKYGFDKIGLINTETKTETESNTTKNPKDKQEKEDQKMIKETEKLEKQLKETMEVALKLQKEAETAMEIAKKNQTEYMTIYNQILGKLKNDELKKMCQTLKMTKTVYGNKEEYLKGIFEYLNDKNVNELKDLSKELNLKGNSIISIVYYLSKNTN